MKLLFNPIIVLAYVIGLASLSMPSQAQEKMVIALTTSEFELAETDISSLATGESKTIETGNGKVVDILKTRDGVEIYVDGELLEVNQAHDGHTTETHVEIICDDEENCEEDIVVIADDEMDISGWVTDNGDSVFIHKEIVHACNDDENTSCGGQTVRVGDESEIHIQQTHDGESGHKIIVIKKDVLVED